MDPATNFTTRPYASDRELILAGAAPTITDARKYFGSAVLHFRLVLQRLEEIENSLEWLEKGPMG